MATGSQGKWPYWMLAAFAALVSILLAGGFILNSSRVAPSGPALEAVAANGTKDDAGEGRGTLKVWVPAEVVGEDYWVYLNGHIVSAPPHGIDTSRLIVMSSIEDDAKKPSGWFISSTDWTFVVRHGSFLMTDSFRNYIKQNLSNTSTDSQGLFYLVSLPLHAGQYTVQIAYRSKNGSSYPFALGNRYITRVDTREIKQLYVGIPDEWARFENARAAMSNASCDERPDVRYLLKQMNTYLSDPVVEALTASQESSPSGQDGNVMLGLPLSEGGTREYDRAQIRLMANAILSAYYDIDHKSRDSYVDDCRNSHPEWSASLDEYEKTQGVIKRALEPIRALAGR